MPLASNTFRQELEEARLTLRRMCGEWSYTGKPINWRINAYLQHNPRNDYQALLCTIRAYGAASAAVGDEMLYGNPPPKDWDKKFADIGQVLMFLLPESLPYTQQYVFEKESVDVWLQGWQGAPYPSPSPR